ncbi:hypothetical protein LINPERPRIM_LOCUS31929 [Linum perenne]
MRLNPGHYVSLIIPLPSPAADQNLQPAAVQFTRVKLLRPTHTLALGHAYRLVPTQGMEICTVSQESLLLCLVFVSGFT